jgi:hypothetical protein
MYPPEKRNPIRNTEKLTYAISSFDTRNGKTGPYTVAYGTNGKVPN